jgi:hypothetical protein
MVTSRAEPPGWWETMLADGGPCMRSTTFVVAVLSLVFASSSALAQKKPKGDKKKADGPSAAATWTDPVENEKSDKGPFTPKTDGDAEPPPEPTTKRAPDRGRKRDKIQAFGQILFGFGHAPTNTPNYGSGNKGTAIGFQVGGRYDVTPAFSGGLRIPLTYAVVQDNGKNLQSTLFGSPELFGEYRISLSRLTSVPLLFGVGIPVAQGNPDYLTGTDTLGHQQTYVQMLADATSGWRDSELFQPKRLPIVLGGGIRHEPHDWEAHADAKFVLLPALSTKVETPHLQTSAYTGDYKINAFALREVTTIGASYNFLEEPMHMYAGLDLAVVWTPIQTLVFESADGNNSGRPTTVQAVLEPRVGARFGRLAPSLGYIAPLGGRLGNANDGGVRLRVDAFF